MFPFVLCSLCGGRCGVLSAFSVGSQLSPNLSLYPVFHLHSGRPFSPGLAKHCILLPTRLTDRLSLNFQALIRSRRLSSPRIQLTIKLCFPYPNTAYAGDGSTFPQDLPRKSVVEARVGGYDVFQTLVAGRSDQPDAGSLFKESVDLLCFAAGLTAPPHETIDDFITGSATGLCTYQYHIVRMGIRLQCTHSPKPASRMPAHASTEVS